MKRDISNKTNNSKQKKRDKVIYRFFISEIIVFVFYYIFFESTYLGDNIKYDIFVFWIPVLLGILIIIKYNLLQIKWSEFQKGKNRNSSSITKIMSIIYLIVMFFMTSVMFFWIPSNIIWDIINKIESNKNKVEVYNLTISKFQDTKGRSSDKIYFTFKDKSESISVEYKYIKPYLDKKPQDFKIKLEVKEGVWNHYVLQSWDIIKK